MIYCMENTETFIESDDTGMDTFAVGDMSMAAYGYLRGFPLVGVEKRPDGYTVFHFRPEDARQIATEYRNPQTEVRLQAYLAALKYLQTLRADTRSGTSQWAETGASL